MSYDLVGATEAAEILGVSVQRIGALCRNGVLEGAQKIGGGWVIPREVVERRKREDPQPGWKKGRPRK